MATVMEFRSAADEFPLGTVFENLPKASVELERLIPHGELIIPYFWVQGAKAEDIESAFEYHTGVVEVELIDNIDDDYLMRAEWENAYFGILSALALDNVSLLSGVGTKDGWEFEVRAETREDISDFRANCQEHDISLEITSVHELMAPEQESEELTDPQHEALLLAYERGYFDTPRETTLAELADELEITQQSLSSRLKRGHRQLIASTVARP